MQKNRQKTKKYRRDSEKALTGQNKKPQNPFSFKSIISSVFNEGTQGAIAMADSFASSSNCVKAIKFLKKDLKCTAGRKAGSKCANDVYWGLLNAGNRGAPLAEKAMNNLFDRMFAECCKRKNAK